MPLKKSARSKTTAASKKSSTTGARSKKKSRTPSWSVGVGTMLLAAMCVTGAVIVIAAHELTPARESHRQKLTPNASRPPIRQRRLRLRR